MSKSPTPSVSHSIRIVCRIGLSLSILRVAAFITTMRENRIRLSDEEHQKLKEATERIFQTNEVPFGLAVGYMADKEINSE